MGVKGNLLLLVNGRAMIKSMDLIYALIYLVPKYVLLTRITVEDFCLLSRAMGMQTEGFKQDVDMIKVSKIRLTLAGRELDPGNKWIKMNLWGGFVGVLIKWRLNHGEGSRVVKNWII